MKKQIILTGAGGCMRELLWQIEELNKQCDTWEVLGYVDISPEASTIWVGEKSYPCLGDDDYLLARREETNVAICVGNSILRKNIADRLMQNPCLQFPNILLSYTCICEDVKMGKGNIISMDARISTNVSLGDFTFLNMGAVVCHDGVLEDYATLNPDARLAGDVRIGKGCEIGMGARIIQGIQIGDGATIGAGSVVIRDVPEACTMAGVPARRIK